jgi:MarR family transcriptional regulator, transcriptional regulator for hemolysin
MQSIGLTSTWCSTLSREQFANWIAVAARQWRRAVDLRLQAYGLTEATWLPLLSLARAPTAMRQKDLAAALALDSSSIVRILQGLQEAGLIARSEDSEDRRAKVIVITDRGRTLAEQVEEVAGQVRREVLARLNDRDIALATEVLQEVCRALAVIDDPETRAA